MIFSNFIIVNIKLIMFTGLFTISFLLSSMII